jgi:fructose-specific phosphotransferase system IIC component
MRESITNGALAVGLLALLLASPTIADAVTSALSGRPVLAIGLVCAALAAPAAWFITRPTDY